MIVVTGRSMETPPRHDLLGEVAIGDRANRAAFGIDHEQRAGLSASRPLSPRR